MTTDGKEEVGRHCSKEQSDSQNRTKTLKTASEEKRKQWKGRQVKIIKE